MQHFAHPVTVLERGEGSYVYTPPADAGFDGPEASSSHGKKYLDFTAGESHSYFWRLWSYLKYKGLELQTWGIVIQR